ncbi:hypothetical protein RRG08_026018 [Elysia crispata]|uniref:Uncharacterized protein n=1 Tax=Elysia crispata TaxID=231223 RepID=A0AAE1BCT4_9GAST|nr:hypothetical protein RRG08_026018 [Elysia crispata]
MWLASRQASQAYCNIPVNYFPIYGNNRLGRRSKFLSSLSDDRQPVSECTDPGSRGRLNTTAILRAPQACFNVNLKLIDREENLKRCVATVTATF